MQKFKLIKTFIEWISIDIPFLWKTSDFERIQLIWE